MITFITIIHVITCVLLIVTILMQSGKGGGLAQGFDSAENLLGAQTNVFMVRLTTVLAIVFLCTCIAIGILTSKKQRSLVMDLPERQQATTVNVEKLFDQAPSQTIVINAATDTK